MIITLTNENVTRIFISAKLIWKHSENGIHTLVRHLIIITAIFDFKIESLIHWLSRIRSLIHHGGCF